MASLGEIQHAAKYGNIVYSGHASDQCNDRNVRDRDVKCAIASATGVVVQEQEAHRVEGGTDQDGKELIVVVRPIQLGLLLVTVFYKS